jgi:serine/alanine adding enzyme
MKFISNSEIDNLKWNVLFQESSYASPFQNLLQYNFLNSIKGFAAEVFAVEEDNNYTSLVVLSIQREPGVKSYFTRRGIIYGGPVVHDGNIKSLEFLLSNISLQYKSKLIYIESRNYFDYSKYDNAFKKNNFIYVPWLNFQLSAIDMAGMKKSMSEARLRQVKKAFKSGVTYRQPNNIEEVSKYYQILQGLYHKKIKKPLFPEEFFLELYRQKIGKFFIVFFQNVIIGGIVCLILENKAIYEFYVCGLDTEYKDQHPSVISTWAAMEFANANGIPIFDFMGAGSPEDQYGVREFKARFGGQLVEHGRYLKVYNGFLYRLGVLGLKIISKFK